MSDAEFIANLQRRYDMLENDVAQLHCGIVTLVTRNEDACQHLPAFENRMVNDIWEIVRKRLSENNTGNNKER